VVIHGEHGVTAEETQGIIQMCQRGRNRLPFLGADRFAALGRRRNPVSSEPREVARVKWVGRLIAKPIMEIRESIDS
jgi:hypothetical protein